MVINIMYYLFSSPPTRESIETRLECAMLLVSEIDMRYKEHFMNLLNNRKADFENELQNAPLRTYEHQRILEQYERFAKTLVHCLEKPQRASEYITYYHRQRYYPVGIKDSIKPSPYHQAAALSAAGLGLLLLASSIPTFMFNPIVAIIMLAVGIALLLPSTFALLLPDSPDTSKKKEEEKVLFHSAAKLVSPSLNFYPEVDEPQSPGLFARI